MFNIILVSLIKIDQKLVFVFDLYNLLHIFYFIFKVFNKKYYFNKSLVKCEI